MSENLKIDTRDKKILKMLEVASFIDQIIDLTIAEERKRVVEMIEKDIDGLEIEGYPNPYNETKRHIINLITNTNK